MDRSHPAVCGLAKRPGVAKRAGQEGEHARPGEPPILRHTCSRYNQGTPTPSCPGGRASERARKGSNQAAFRSERVSSLCPLPEVPTFFGSGDTVTAASSDSDLPVLCLETLARSPPASPRVTPTARGADPSLPRRVPSATPANTQRAGTRTSSGWPRVVPLPAVKRQRCSPTASRARFLDQDHGRDSRRGRIVCPWGLPCEDFPPRCIRTKMSSLSLA